MNLEIDYLWSHKCPKKWDQYTLVALVVTIVILLILAGITIATLTGDNGLIGKAGEAKNATEEAEIEEQIRLAYLKYESKKSKKTDETLENIMKTSLESAFNEQINVEKTGNDLKITFTDSNKVYKYYSNDKIKRLMIPTEKLYGKLDENEKILYLSPINKNGYNLFNKTTARIL